MSSGASVSPDPVTSSDKVDVEEEAAPDEEHERIKKAVPLESSSVAVDPLCLVQSEDVSGSPGHGNPSRSESMLRLNQQEAMWGEQLLKQAVADLGGTGSDHDGSDSELSDSEHFLAKGAFLLTPSHELSIEKASTICEKMNFKGLFSLTKTATGILFKFSEAEDYQAVYKKGFHKVTGARFYKKVPIPCRPQKTFCVFVLEIPEDIPEEDIRHSLYKFHSVVEVSRLTKENQPAGSGGQQGSQSQSSGNPSSVVFQNSLRSCVEGLCWFVDMIKDEGVRVGWITDNCWESDIEDQVAIWISDDAKQTKIDDLGGFSNTILDYIDHWRATCHLRARTRLQSVRCIWRERRSPVKLVPRVDPVGCPSWRVLLQCKSLHRCPSWLSELVSVVTIRLNHRSLQYVVLADAREYLTAVPPTSGYNSID
uniref:Uncharacterized protein n=1 Tax=Timema monikensis TaxID=170555 RepID=A0A7R9E8W6_9NEOP|nr:unnamed protein product [Timema monikensis]